MAPSGTGGPGVAVGTGVAVGVGGGAEAETTTTSCGGFAVSRLARLIAVALVVVMATAIVDKVLMALAVPAGSLAYTFWMLVMNLVIAWATVSLLRTYAHVERIRVGEPKPVARPELSGVKPPGISEV